MDLRVADDRATDFGFERVPWGDKARRVRGVFDSVAGNYDLMNDLMSGGAHRLWKQFTLSLANLRPGQSALDVAGGTGDLAARKSPQPIVMLGSGQMLQQRSGLFPALERLGRIRPADPSGRALQMNDRFEGLPGCFIMVGEKAGDLVQLAPGERFNRFRNGGM